MQVMRWRLLSEALAPRIG